jgi:septal ring factor EnvC (AmiA/AmiB activator)
VAVDPHQSSELNVGERADLAEKIVINPDMGRAAFLVTISKYTPDLEAKLRPLLDAESALSEVNRKLNENQHRQKTDGDDEARIRENVTALKGNEASKRFVDELNRAEDDLDAARKEQASLEQQRDTARVQLTALIAQLSFEADLNVVTEDNQIANPQ